MACSTPPPPATPAAAVGVDEHGQQLVLRESIEERYLYFDPTHRLRLRDGVVVPRPAATPEQVLQIAERMPNQITPGRW